MIKCIDTHVHFRDWEEAYKETILGGAEKAAGKGILAVGDMPNTKPQVLRFKDAIARLELAGKGRLPVKYFTWVGLTPDESQIAEAVRAAKEIPQVIGLKLYAGESVGALGVVDLEDQKKIYKVLVDLRYKGVVAVHCEKVDRFKKELWDPKKPWTHGLARPIAAEAEAIKDQIEFIRIAGFTGHLHICHISCVEGIYLVAKARESGVKISCEITPHHALLNDSLLKDNDGLGLFFKVNPPLRRESVQKELFWALSLLIRDKANWIFIASDYAPHKSEEKLNPPYLSGIADFQLYRGLINWLGDKLSSSEIEQFTYHNAKKIFGEKLKDI